MNSLLGSAIAVRLMVSVLLLPAASVGGQSLPMPAATSTAQDYDQVIAYIPQAQAETASVALAKLIIALHDARAHAARQLCNGTRTPSGTAVQRFGPSLTDYSASQNVWFYHSLRRAFPLSCGKVSRAQFFLEMSRHLPAWVFLRPAGQELTLSQGATLGPVVQARLAGRFSGDQPDP